MEKQKEIKHHKIKDLMRSYGIDIENEEEFIEDMILYHLPDTKRVINQIQLKQGYEGSIKVDQNDVTGTVEITQNYEGMYSNIFIEKQSIPAMIEALKKYVE